MIGVFKIDMVFIPRVTKERYRLTCRRVLNALLLFFLMTQCLHGAEIDSVTPRDLALDNAVNRINSIFNQRLAEGVESANRKSGDDFCNEETLYVELRKSVFQSFTASWGLKGYALDRQMRELLSQHSYSLALNDSIYRDLDYLESFSLNLKELSDVINVGGHLVGIDKIGHFFAEGWRYFELTSIEGYPLQDAISWGVHQEKGKFGYATTGIYSFADLTANFNGWLFWNKVLLKDDDPLKGKFGNFFNRPYVSCDVQIVESLKQQKIVRAWDYKSSFDLSDYSDGAWDEGDNCNSYRNPTIEAKVESRIKRVDADWSCPMNKKNCQRARQRYGSFSKYLLHPSCLTAG